MLHCGNRLSCKQALHWLASQWLVVVTLAALPLTSKTHPIPALLLLDQHLIADVPSVYLGSTVYQQRSQGEGSTAALNSFEAVVDVGLSISALFLPGTGCVVTPSLDDKFAVLSPCLSDSNSSRDDGIVSLVNKLRPHAADRKTVRMVDGSAISGLVVDAKLAGVTLFVSLRDAIVEPHSKTPSLDLRSSTSHQKSVRLPVEHWLMVDHVTAPFASSRLSKAPVHFIIGLSPVALHSLQLHYEGVRRRSLSVPLFAVALTTPEHVVSRGTPNSQCLATANAFELALSKIEYVANGAASKNVRVRSKMVLTKPAATVAKAFTSQLVDVTLDVFTESTSTSSCFSVNNRTAGRREADDHERRSGGVLQQDIALFASAAVGIEFGDSWYPFVIHSLCELLASLGRTPSPDAVVVDVTLCASHGAVRVTWPRSSTDVPRDSHDVLAWLGCSISESALSLHLVRADAPASYARSVFCTDVLTASNISSKNRSAHTVVLRIPVKDLIEVSHHESQATASLTTVVNLKLLVHSLSPLSRDGARDHHHKRSLLDFRRVAVIVGTSVLASNDLGLGSHGGIGIFEPVAVNSVSRVAVAAPLTLSRQIGSSVVHETLPVGASATDDAATMLHAVSAVVGCAVCSWYACRKFSKRLMRFR